MNKKYFISSPSYGFIKNNFKRFNDEKLFKNNSHLFTKLNRIKIWFGSSTVKEKEKENKEKVILGIEVNYKLLSKGEKPQRYLAPLITRDIETKELILKNNSEYFSKMYLCVDDVITYLKFETNKGQVIEAGNFDKNKSKEISFNDDKIPHVIQLFHGFYDDNGLRALGVRHMQITRYYFMNNMDILAIRYRIKHNKTFREKWEKEENVEKLNREMKAILKLALLPDNPFGFIFKYIID